MIISADIVIRQQALDRAFETREIIQATITLSVFTVAMRDILTISAKMPTFENGRLTYTECNEKKCEEWCGGTMAIWRSATGETFSRIVSVCRAGNNE